MKVLGITQEGYSHGYIVQVSHDELKAALEKGYSEHLTKHNDGKLRVGDELNLGDIPDQRQKIVRASESMVSAVAGFHKAVTVMAEAARVIAAERQNIPEASK